MIILGRLSFQSVALSLLVAGSYSAQAIQPNDPLLNNNTEPKEYQWGIQSLNMPEVWNYSKGHAYVGVVDLGIDPDHPDLQMNFRPHFSFNHVEGTDDVDELHENITDYAGHGTHVAGIIAASTDNSVGVAGICWNCSLMMQKTGVPFRAGSPEQLYYVPDTKAYYESVFSVVSMGAQVINFSIGAQTNKLLFDINNNAVDSCNQVPSAYQIYQAGTGVALRIKQARSACDALAYAESMDVVLVAAAGNYKDLPIQFPAVDPRVIAVGAVDRDGSVPEWSSDGAEKDIVTPGVNIVSTFYPDREWNATQSGSSDKLSPECADELGALSGYGPCSGTSMSTPHASGIAAIIRSINPLLKKDQVKDLLVRYASHSTTPDNTYGYGFPDTVASVEAALGSANGAVLLNRLTPLFSLWSDTGKDHFYTTVPQMAMAAMYEAMAPQPASGTVEWVAAPGTDRVPGYESFPRYSWCWWWDCPTAEVYIFTTYKNPLAGDDLVPLYRLSYQGDVTGTNPQNIDHTYTTSYSEVIAYQNIRYKLDGIEGYIFKTPQSGENPPHGTVKLYKRYNRARDDHAIFPQTELSRMENEGYTVQDGIEVLGYVYLNQDSDGDGLIDGFEDIIGTSNSNTDSDGDGIKDGKEVNSYPYSDPLL